MRQEATARVVQPNEGEQLELRNGHAVIKMGPTMGSPRLAMGTQELRAGAGVPVHTHENADEIVFVHGGKGVVIVGGERKHIEAGTTVYVPPGVLHGFENPGESVQLFWVVSPAGLENFFRETGWPPGGEPKALTSQQIDGIRRKHEVPGRSALPSDDAQG
jgi:quercetin dioxygenase-like cupin family protein